MKVIQISREEVRKYWESRPPGILHSRSPSGSLEFFEDIERQRYSDKFKYAYLKEHAEFDKHSGESVLEIGMGLGTDILQFARNGSKVSGIDLTQNSVETVKHRFELYGLKGDFRQADFRSLPYHDNTFDVVYSFGVLHHSPYISEGVQEIHRVLKPGGIAIVMLYHKGFKYYIRKLLYQGIFKLKYLRYSTQEIINMKTEDFGNSPCTLVVNRQEASDLFINFNKLEMKGHRIDDYIKIFGQFLSPTYMLPKSIRCHLENKFGWNLLIKASK